MSAIRKFVQFVTGWLPRLLPCVALLAGIAVMPIAAHAASPWVDTVNTLANDISGPIARGLSLVAIVIGGLVLAFSEGGDSKRMLAGIVFGVGMAIGAVNFMTWLFP